MSLYSHAVIFAGGKSSRMGQDKALLPFGKHTSLTAYQYEKFKKVFDTVSISTKYNKFDFDCPLIIDIYEESSPLVGILSIFKVLENVDTVFIISVDAPFINEKVIHTLIEKDQKGVDAIVAKSPNGIQPLCGLYKRSILPLAQEQYNKDNHKLQDLLDIAKTKIVDFQDNTLFTNMNHIEEYKKAFKLSLT